MFCKYILCTGEDRGLHFKAFKCIGFYNSQFRHVNHSEISDQSDRCRWNHHCNDAILSHTLTLIACEGRSEFTKFDASWWIKMSWKPKFSLKLLWAHYTDVRWCYCRSNYTRTVYRRIPKFFKQTWNARIWMLLFFKWFFLWVSKSFQAQKFCDSFMCIPSVFIGQKCCVFTLVQCSADSCRYVRYVYEP